MLRFWTLPHRALALALVLGGASAATLATAPAAHATAANRILDVEVRAENDQRIIRIATASAPTFTVFRLSNPMRVVIDISGGDVSPLDSPLVFEDGMVSSIATRQFDANGFLIGRLTLGFEAQVAYDVKAEGNAVVVRAAAHTTNLPRRAIVTPSAPITKGASERVDELRREVETAKRNAERERQQAEAAKDHAATQLAEAQRVAAAAERKAKDAESARAEAAKLRAQAEAAAARDREDAERRAARAEARLEELQSQAQSLASQRAEAERAAAQAARAEQQAVAAAARAEALHKEHVAEQQELIAAAQAAQARAASEKEAAEAARKRAVAAKREAEQATALAERRRTEAEASAAEMERKIAEIDRRETRAQAALAKLTAEKKAVERERRRLEQAKTELARTNDELSRKKSELAEQKSALANAQAELEREREAVAMRQQRLDEERKRLEHLRTKADRTRGEGSSRVASQRRELDRLKSQVEEDKRGLAAERQKLAAQRQQLEKRRKSLAEREEELARVSTRELVRESERPKLASTSVPAIRGSLKGVRSRPDGVLLQIDGSASYELLRVEDPPRLVVRLDHVTRETRRLSYGVDNDLVRRVRLGDHENATHAVLDLTSGAVKHSVETTEDGVLVSLSGEGSTEAVAVNDVNFEGSRQSARITIDVDPDVRTEIDDRSRRAWVLKLHDARVSRALERSLDTSKYGSVVGLLSTYQASSEPPVVNIVASLRGAARQSLRREGGQLVWELEGVADAPQVANRTERREQSTAAFREAASAVSRSVVPTQRRSGQRVTLDFKDADIINVIRLIADTTGENIIAADDVKGKVTVKLRNVPWERALDVILKSRGYDKVRSGGIIRIATAEAIAAERERAIAARKAQEQVEETVIKIVPINYADAADIVAQIKPSLSSRGSVQVDSRTNSLIIEDVRSNINRIVEISTILDKQTPLVLIEARIVEATSNFEQEFGIQWGGTSQFTRANGNPTGLAFPSDVVVSGAGDDPTVNPTQGISAPGRYAVNLPAPIGAGAGGGLGFIFGSAGSDQLLQLRLSALESSGSGRIISSPRITTLDNKTAKIGQGVDIPITVVSAAGANTRLIPANLELEVTPHVTNDGSIVMEIAASKNEPDFTNTGAFGDPSILRNFAETEILVADGETAVIGGIYTRSTARRTQKVPFLGDLPVIGWLFRNERETDDRSELLVFITPRIVNRDAALRPSDELVSPSPG